MPPSPCSLRRPGWRTECRPPTLDRLTAKFFLPVKVLSPVFRGKFVAGLRELHADGKLGFHGDLAHLQAPQAFAAWLRPLFRSDWVVYSKRPFGGAEHALRYLGCYTHRVAISNHRLVSLAEGRVTFRWRDSAHKNKKRLMTLSVEEFLRRFLLHVLPRGFVRIRHFGFFAHRRRAALLPLCRQLLAVAVSTTPSSESESISGAESPLWRCPRCGGPMVLIERLTPTQARLRSHRWEPDNVHDSIFLISDIRRAPARLLDVYPSIGQRARKRASPATDLPPFTPDSLGKPLSSQYLSPPGDSVPHQKPIAAEFQTASFKSLYRKRSGNQESHLPSSLICRSVSDTAIGLFGKWLHSGPTSLVGN